MIHVRCESIYMKGRIEGAALHDVVLESVLPHMEIFSANFTVIFFANCNGILINKFSGISSLIITYSNSTNRFQILFDILLKLGNFHSCGSCLYLMLKYGSHDNDDDDDDAASVVR